MCAGGRSGMEEGLSGSHSVSLALPEVTPSVHALLCTCHAAGTSTPRGDRSMSIDDFEILKPISRGAFGRVYLAREWG